MTESTTSDTERPPAGLPDPTGADASVPDHAPDPAYDADADADQATDSADTDAPPAADVAVPDAAVAGSAVEADAAPPEVALDSDLDLDLDRPGADATLEEPAPGTGGSDEAAEPDVSGEDEESGDAEGLARLEREGDIAADYLEELLDIADLDGDLDMDVEGDRAAVSIVGGDVRELVGRDGEVLEALQELTRLAVYRETGERSRLMLDVGGFRADRRARLEKLALETVAEVRATDERKALDPMSPFERKVVHDAVAAAGLSSASEGVEPRRYVVVLPR